MALEPKILLITPPFTQLNTPYPATAYLKGFLKTKGIACEQLDLGIEVILRLFSRAGLSAMFDAVDTSADLSENSRRIYAMRQQYLLTIEPVIDFLQDKNPTLAHLICEGNYLPEASRFAQLDELEWAFGTMGIRDKARHLATLYLEDLADLVKEAVDPHFGFSRYAERLALSATSFDPLYTELTDAPGFIDHMLFDILEKKVTETQPDVVALSIPFPGNLYGGLRCGQWLKQHMDPEVRVVMGGGYANTELRTVKDVRLFEFVDYVTLDDGEAPILHLIEHLRGVRSKEALKRTLTLSEGTVIYCNGSKEKDVPQREVGTPDYHGLPLDKYLSVIEIANPMHRLWSDGRWNKLTLAHGCYWGKCTFCDISLDYIKRYEPVTASVICDRIEELIAATGERGFHFVDEAAPPALMRDVALEIIRRGLTVVWWTNIRFEKSFTSDLCQLLAASGCIAVSGGLEVASDRLLQLIDKGVTVAQVARVAQHFTQAGIKVHAYLMYGFPTQTAQETIDSLEVVRQLFMEGVVQSGYWHQFAMTAHSPVGMFPEKFKVEKIPGQEGDFANNDIRHIDKEGAIHDVFSEGLKKSLFNYMHGMCFDFPLGEWFDFNVPKTSLPEDYITAALEEGEPLHLTDNTKVVWLGGEPSVRFYTKKKKGKTTPMAELLIRTRQEDVVINVKAPLGKWLAEVLPSLSPQRDSLCTFARWEADFEQNELGNMEVFMQSYTLGVLREHGLLLL